MSAKQVLGAVLTIAGIALMATGIGAPLGTIALGAGLGAISVASVVGMGLLLTSSLLLGPSVPKVGASLKTNQDRLYATLTPTEPRKIVFGNTAAATDVRYQAFTGANQGYYEDIVCSASHTCNSLAYEIWFDNEKAWASSTVQGRYSGYLTVDVRNPGTSANGIAIDGTWTTSCTLTGCAYSHLKYRLTGPDQSTPSPFQGGVSSRLTVRTKGALVYDPRKDSTVTGGSGTQRAADQTTWAWDDNGSRNPALQILFYLIGWQINGKLAVGMGIPSARLDLPSFITAANVCDEAIPLAAGGTEPRYRCDGVVSEGDDRNSTIDALCGTMNASLHDHGGKISLQVITNDLANIAVAFGSADIIGEEEWVQTPPLTQYFNIYRGRYVDASDNALYQLSNYPEKKVTSPDGIDRINTFDQPFVQSVTQAQRLAKLRLMRNQYQGRYTATFGPRAWAASIGQIVTLSHPGLGWTNRLFRVAGQSLGRDGKVAMTLIEENSAIYDWATTDEGTAITAGTPPVTDPTLNPVVAATTADVSELIKLSEPVNPDPSTPILTASETQIFVKDHQRRYSDKTVNVTGNTSGAILDETGQPILDESGNTILDESGSSSSLTGLTAGTTYYIGYNDQGRAGGVETYIASTNIYTVTNSGAGGATPYMHFVGFVTTAGAGTGGTTSGGVAAPPGSTAPPGTVLP